MYRRRVQIVGGSTYILSLPKSWAEKVDLKEGEELFVEELSNQALLIYAPERREHFSKAEISFTCKESRNFIERTIIAQYLAGKKEIVLHASDVECKKTLSSIADSLKKKVLGLEILEETSNDIVLGAILDTTFSDITHVINSMMKTIIYMLEDLAIGLRKNDLKIIKDIYQRDDYIDRLYLYSIRYLVNIYNMPTQERINPSSSVHYALATKSLERIGDHVSAISKNLEVELVQSNINDKEKEGILNLINSIKDLESQILKLVLKFDGELLNEITEKAINLMNVESELRASLLKYSVNLSYVAESLRRIIAYSIDLLESVLDINVLQT
ncbi:MAG: PhoU domain-containing protein [Fervidicoccus sp.]